MFITSKCNILLFSSVLLFLAFSNTTFAQSEKTKKMTIITKTIDDNGNETTTKVVTDKDNMSEEEINELIEKTLKEEGIDADVDVRVDGDGKKMPKNDDNEVEKEITIKIKTTGTKEELEKDEVMIFKTDDGEVIQLNGKDIKMSEMKDGTEMIIEEEIIEKNGKIEKRIKKIKRGGTAPKGAFLGIMMDVEAEDQVKVTETVEGSAAQKAGLQNGDIIKSVDGKTITGHQSLLDALSSKKANDKVNIAYEREGKQMKTQATLTEYNGEMKVIKEMKMDDMDEDEEHIWKNKDGNIIELEDGQKMILIEKDGAKTTTTKKTIRKKGTTKKTIEIEIEKDIKEEKGN